MTEDRVKRKLRAIFSADVKGYSRLMGEDELATVETLTSHKETMGKLIRQYRGRVVDSTGDNLLAEFASVVDAVQCAVEVQQVIRSKNETLPDNRRMFFRIGINLGDVIEEGESIYGDGVNIAARVESLAQGGGISLSGTAYDQLGKKLPLGYEYLGEQSVKNIEKPVRVYRVLTEAEAVGIVIGEKRRMPIPCRWTALAIAIVILAAGALVLWKIYLRPDFEPASVEKMAFSLPDKPSIAVLPFKNISGDRDQEFLADGITENIITALSKTPKMFVIASNSVFTYKGKPVKVQQVAEEMGVRYVLEGSLQSSDDRLRITAQLVDALEGHHLWAERYDREMKDLFTLQDEMTMKVLTAMEINLTEGEAATAHAKGTSNLEAYLKDLKGREYVRKMTKEDNAIARKLLEESIALDPKYASAHVGLAYTYMVGASRGWSESSKQSFIMADKLCQKALEIDDSLDIAYSLAGRLSCYKRQYEKAISEGEKAIGLGPNNSGNMAMLAFTLMQAGKSEEAVKWAEKAIRINPKPPLLYLSILGHAYRDAGRYDEAITIYERVLKQVPNYDVVPIALAGAYYAAGYEEKARDLIDELLKRYPQMSIEVVRNYFERLQYKSEDIYGKVMEDLRKAGMPETPALPLPDKPSIAVLPFANMSGDPEQEYFCDGITEEIITALSKVPDLLVIARNSSFTYKGKSVWIPKVGRELGVRSVLEGSVRKAGGKVRITAQLVDAKTAHHLWAERYDRELEDLFAVQDDITKKIVMALQINLTPDERTPIYAKGTDSLEAYLMALKGQWYTRKTTRESILNAEQMAKAAIGLDPNYAFAHCLLGNIYGLTAWHGMTKSPGEAIKRCIALLQKAISLDNSLAIAHALMGWYLISARQYDKALAAGERALSLAPAAADIISLYATILTFSGRDDEAIPLFQESLRLDPKPSGNHLYRTYGTALANIGLYEEAIAFQKKAIAKNPNDFFAYLVLASIYSFAGRNTDAKAAGKEVLRLKPSFSVAQIERVRRDKDPAVAKRWCDALRKAGLPE